MQHAAIKKKKTVTSRAQKNLVGPLEQRRKFKWSRYTETWKTVSFYFKQLLWERTFSYQRNFI